jgi:hypothetical protein
MTPIQLYVLDIFACTIFADSLHNPAVQYHGPYKGGSGEQTHLLACPTFSVGLIIQCGVSLISTCWPLCYLYIILVVIADGCRECRGDCRMV